MVSLQASVARSETVRILNRFEESGAYVNLLTSGTRSRGLRRDDAAFMYLLSMGVLKNRLALDWVLTTYCSPSFQELPLSIRNILRLGAFELIHLPEKPAAVVVYEYVSLARKLGHVGTARLVNAVLRRVAERRHEIVFPRVDEDPVRAISICWSHPAWLVARWIRQFGVDEAEAICSTNNEPAPVCLRVNSLLVSVERALAYLEDVGISFHTSARVENCVVLDALPVGGLTAWEGLAKGWFAIQDEASQLVSLALSPHRDEVIVDACAAPGGKTAHIGALMQNTGTIIAIDTRARRMRLVEENCCRLGVTNVTYRIGDFCEVAREITQTADVCLVDAPCSGTGVLRRKPDIRWRRRESELAGLGELQLRLLRAAASVVKPGGRVLYSTCSLEHEENAGVIARFLEERSDFRHQPFSESSRLPGEVLTEEGFLFCVPHRHQTDGAFAALIVHDAKE